MLREGKNLIATILFGSKQYFVSHGNEFPNTVRMLGTAGDTGYFRLFGGTDICEPENG